MDPENPWKELEAAALLGTERRAFAPTGAPGDLGTLTAGLAGREPEKILLGTAAALAMARRAGRKFGEEASPLAEPAAEDARPRCSGTAASHLSLMFAGDRTALMGEWLAALAAAGRRVPEEHLPALLGVARFQAALRPAILAVIGERGRWLARQNPDWAFVEATEESSSAGDEGLWQTGTAEQRTALLGRVRAADPARARDLVASTWASDGPADRAAFAALFEVGLSADDEPFLEAALDDRRKEVRATAAELLARLPGSALVGRMKERIAPLVGLDGLDPPRSSRKPFADIDLPPACDKGMIRDGIEPKPQRHGMGERAWWFAEILGRIPPSLWAQAWGRPAADLVAAAVSQKKWRETLFPSLVAAARRYGDDDWIEAVLPHRKLIGYGFDAAGLFNVLPADRRETVALRMLAAEGGLAQPGSPSTALSDDLMFLFESVPAPWGDGFSGEILARLRENVRTSKYFDYVLTRFLKVAAVGLPAAAAMAAATAWTLREADLPPSDRGDFDDFLATLQFRIDMVKELSP